MIISAARSSEPYFVRLGEYFPRGPNHQASTECVPRSKGIQNMPSTMELFFIEQLDRDTQNDATNARLMRDQCQDLYLDAVGRME